MNAFTIGKKYSVTGKYLAISYASDPSTSALGGIYVHNGGGSQLASYSTMNTSTEFSVTFTATSTDLNIYARNKGGGTWVQMNDKDRIYLIDIEVTELTVGNFSVWPATPADEFFVKDIVVTELT